MTRLRTPPVAPAGPRWPSGDATVPAGAAAGRSVDTMPERRATTFARPGAPPVRIKVAVRPVPQRLADGDLRAAECAGAEQLRSPAGTGPMPMLEHHVRRAAAGPLRLGDDVELGQGRARRLLDQH